MIDASKETLKEKLHQCVRRIHEKVFRHKVIKFISYHLIQHFQIIKRHVSLIKYLNNVTEWTRTNTTQHYLEWMRNQLLRSYLSDLNGLYTNGNLKYVPTELKTDGKYMQCLVILFTVQ